MSMEDASYEGEINDDDGEFARLQLDAGMQWTKASKQAT
jgi:hypothetical protein